MDAKQIEEAINEIEQIVLNHTPGDHPQPRRRIETLILSIRSNGNLDSYGSEKLGTLEENANMYFSARRFNNYPGGHQGLKIAILTSCQGVLASLP